MRKGVFFILVLISVICSAYKFIGVRTGYSLHLQITDTLKYLRDSFINNKAAFQHKELSVVLNKLRLPVKLYSIGHSWRPNSKVVVTLFFDDRINSFEKLSSKDHFNCLTVSFDDSVSLKQARKLIFESSTQWRKEETEFYCKFRVKDIRN